MSRGLIGDIIDGEMPEEFGNNIDENGNFKNIEKPGNPSEPAPELTEKKPPQEIVFSQEKYDEQQRLTHEHKAGYKDLTAKEKGEATWVNDNQYTYYEGEGAKRKKSEILTGYANEQDFKDGKMQWGHQTDFTYDKKNNIVFAESKDLKKEGVTWQEETKYGPDGWRKLERSGETTAGPETGRKWNKKYSYREGEIKHDGQKYNGLIETEDGEETAPDGSRKTWQKIVVYNENKEHIAHWRE